MTIVFNFFKLLIVQHSHPQGRTDHARSFSSRNFHIALALFFLNVVSLRLLATGKLLNIDQLVMELLTQYEYCFRSALSPSLIRSQTPTSSMISPEKGMRCVVITVYCCICASRYDTSGFSHPARECCHTRFCLWRLTRLHRTSIFSALQTEDQEDSGSWALFMKNYCITVPTRRQQHGKNTV